MGGSFDTLSSAKTIGRIALTHFSVETCFQRRDHQKNHIHFSTCGSFFFYVVRFRIAQNLALVSETMELCFHYDNLTPYVHDLLKKIQFSAKKHIQSTHALTMNCKTKKVYFATQSSSDLIEQFWLSLLTITGRRTRKARKLTTRSSTRQGKIRNAPRSKAEKKKKVSLKKLKRTRKTRGEGLDRDDYDAKSVERIGGIVE